MLAEVNPCMPRTHGDSFVRVDDIDGLVAVETPVLSRLDALTRCPFDW